jgi:hypothetical protein
MILVAAMKLRHADMSDYDEYNEQVLRFRELLTALNAVLDDLAPADLDSWAGMKQRLPLAQPRANNLLMLRQGSLATQPRSRGTGIQG